jgi:hypothetical protein
MLEWDPGPPLQRMAQSFRQDDEPIMAALTTP